MEATFEKLLVRLARAEVRFVIVGGIAVSLQGYVRLTEDVDILLDCEESNVVRFLESLADYGEGFAREFTLEDFAPEEGALRLIEESEGCQLDIFTVMSGKSYADLAEDAEIFKVQGFEVLYASKKSLIELKSKTADKWADNLAELKTICHCGSKATMNLRTDEKGNAIKEGS